MRTRGVSGRNSALRPVVATVVLSAVALAAGCSETGPVGGEQAQADPGAGDVMAAGGYPDDYRKGDVISGLPTTDAENCKVFHAGTQQENGNVVTTGGRVLCVTSLGDTVEEAQAIAYQTVDKIQWKDAYFRRDIGHRAIARERIGKA